MLSVPSRWISSAAKRDLPSPKSRKSISSGHDVPLTDIHVDPTPTVHADASSAHHHEVNTPPSSSGKAVKSALPDDGTGQLIDYSI